MSGQKQYKISILQIVHTPKSTSSLKFVEVLLSRHFLISFIIIVAVFSIHIIHKTTVDEAVRRIKEGNWENIEFTLPDVYGDDWTMSREDGAGALGKYFFNHITEHPELGIKFVPDRLIKRRAVYTYKKED